VDVKEKNERRQMRRKRWKIILIIGIVALSVWALYPPSEKIHLGLDLLGGMHLILEVDTARLPENVSAGEAVDRALLVIRNRIDQFGVREPLIQKQGQSWIAVQLPGIKDPQRAIDIIGRTALLEFKLVDEKGELPSNISDTSGLSSENEVLYGTDGKAYLLKKEVLMTGAALSLARVDMDEYGRPRISLEFNKIGAGQFARITRRHVGERLAIILDNKVHSAPVIKQEITGGKAIIEGKFSVEEANDLAIVLKAGALPVPFKVGPEGEPFIEKRQVGPSLGEDSIRKGVFAIILGLILVLSFMFFYYRMSGLIADFALLLNIVILLGALAGFGATLTLPGIAGIILTVGMSVDANVLIFERIREEIRGGKGPWSAIAAGYSRAFPAILDSNLTTLITALLLFQFGTGPVKGFAVTLSLGILISMFTAIIVTRVIFDESVPREAQKLSI